mmetsp:Transcript_12683/g.36252  ORF Transcript_12683/g.36252 Transcript_12683/m.36252 type:complete len:206 (-) Transcript_12683:23-640(-)
MAPLRLCNSKSMADKPRRWMGKSSLLANVSVTLDTSCSSRCCLSDPFGKEIRALRVVRPPLPPKPLEKIYWMLHDFGYLSFLLESCSTRATTSVASSLVHLSRPSRYVAPKLLNAAMLFVSAPLVSNTGSPSIPLAALNTLCAVSLPSLWVSSWSDKSLATDPILSSSSGSRERTCLPTFPPMLRHFRINVSSIRLGINSGYTTA